MNVTNQSNPTLVNNLWIGNRTNVHGGAVDVANSDAIFINNAFRGNRALLGSGGAVNNRFGATSRIINNSFSGNAAAYGGAVANADGGSLTRMDNCIVWNNRSGNETNTVSASMDNFSNGAAIIRSSILANSGGSDAWDNAIGSNGGSNKDVDPEFVMVADPSGAFNESGDLRLMPTSPAIDCGADYLYADSFPTTDLYCSKRIEDLTIDLGAYESSDTIGPIINCPADMEVDCMSGVDTMITGMATASDLCGLDTLYFEDSLVSSSCIAVDTLFRTFVAIDNCGNESTCLQLIILNPTPLPCTTFSIFSEGAWDVPPDASRIAIIADDYDTAIHGGFEACSLIVDLGVIFEVQLGDIVDVMNQ
jgi:hypothetical protein